MGYMNHFSRKLCEGELPVHRVDDVCRVVMFDWARPRARFMFRRAFFELNYKSELVHLKQRWEPAKQITSEHLADCFNYMLSEGWLSYSRWKREYERNFYFTKTGIEHWETVERPKFLKKSKAYLRECRRVEAEAENLKRFGVPWDVHEQLREEGAHEWDV